MDWRASDRRPASKSPAGHLSILFHVWPARRPVPLSPQPNSNSHSYSNSNSNETRAQPRRQETTAAGTNLNYVTWPTTVGLLQVGRPSGEPEVGSERIGQVTYLARFALARGLTQPVGRPRNSDINRQCCWPTVAFGGGGGAETVEGRLAARTRRPFLPLQSKSCRSS